LRRKLNKIEGRKAIVLFTDGVDTTSGASGYASTIRVAEESDAVIFPIYYNTFMDTVGMGRGGPMSAPPIIGIPGMGGSSTAQISAAYTRGRAYLAELAGVSGGKVYRAEASAGGLTATFESIAEELRRQYVLGYYPAETGNAGDRKEIRVRVDRPKLIIRTRDTYTVGQK
jgi:Ca-activated chloride channel homolog